MSLRSYLGPRSFFAVTALLLFAGYASALPGDVDQTFNAGAITRDNLTTSVRTIAVQSDGKILIGGDFDKVAGNNRNFIARLNSDGSFDNGFNAVSLQKYLSGSAGAVYKIVIQPDGQILVAGAFQVGIDIKVIVRLNPDGSLDGTFNSDGGGSFAYTIVLQPDGKIIVAGQMANFGGSQSRGIVRLNQNGSLETSLGLAANLTNDVYGVALQSDGKIVVGGNFFVIGSTPTQNNIARLNANGMLDTSFNVGSGTNNTVYATAIQANGKIIAGGFFTNFNGTPRTQIARINPDGSIDSSFAPNIIGGGGVFTIRLLPKAKILVGGGLGSISGNVRSGLARFNLDGSIDAFYPSGGAINNTVYAVAYQPGGGTLIGGRFTSVGGNPRAHLARLIGGRPLNP